MHSVLCVCMHVLCVFLNYIPAIGTMHVDLRFDRFKQHAGYCIPLLSGENRISASGVFFSVFRPAEGVRGSSAAVEML